jgi:hypothetical protein
MLPAYQWGYRVFLGVNAAGVVLTPAATSLCLHRCVIGVAFNFVSVFEMLPIVLKLNAEKWANDS